MPFADCPEPKTKSMMPVAHGAAGIRFFGSPGSPVSLATPGAQIPHGLISVKRARAKP